MLHQSGIRNLTPPGGDSGYKANFESKKDFLSIYQKGDNKQTEDIPYTRTT